jgi:hypothetical protein
MTTTNISLSCRSVIAGLSLVWIFGATASLQAQTQTEPAVSQPVITTDRPAITDASTVVPSGSLVLENGFTATGSQGQASYDLPETLVRFGITGQTELRFTTPDHFDNLTAGAGFGNGWGDLSLGVKQQLVTTSGGFDVALVAALSFPTGENAVSSHGYDPQLLLPWSHPISKNWTAAGMFSLFWPTEGAARNLNGQASFLLDRQNTSRWDTFIEYAGDFFQRGGPQHLLHVGTAFKLTSNQQLDFHCGFGLSSAATDHLVGFGYSFQWQAIHRSKSN